MKERKAWAVLAEEEWNFRTCPEVQRAACAHYEYAREYLHTRTDLAKKLTSKQRPSPYDNALKFIHSDRRHPDSLPMICRDFPGVPWLKLPTRTRTMLIAQCQALPEEDEQNSNLLVEDDFDVSLLQQLDEIRRKLHSKWKQEIHDQDLRESVGLKTGLWVVEDPNELSPLCYGPKRYFAVADYVALAVIQLDWRRSDRKLKAAFERLLKRRPEQYAYANKKQAANGGRGAASDQLNQLGAKRLLAHYGSSEAAVDAVRTDYAKTRYKPPYSDADSLRDAAGKAAKVLNSLASAGRFRAFTDL